ncbi:MAG TPA: hypothetical protein VG937_01085 [Polyangiaceae bacterium]|nr:hypothetical protein [Polyangiaceae bacterium]
MPTPGRWSTLALSFLGVLGAACGRREAPRDFRLELSDMILSADPATITVRLTNEDGTVAASTEEHSFNVSPAGLASVSARGGLTCQRSGDGTVSLTLGSNTRTVPVRCRLVEKVDASDVGRVELTAGPFTPKLRVLGKGGAELEGVPLTLTSKNTGVLVSRGSELVPKMVGNATLLARAGQASQEFKVDVVRKLTPEALPIDQNRKISFSLEAGKYELRVVLPSEKRLSAEWRGAPYCNYTGTNKEHVSVCVLRTKGGVVFDNPGYLTSGSTDVMVDGVSIYEVP